MKTSTILLTSVASTIRTAGGAIWNIDCREYGTQFRVKLSGKNIRVVVPSLTKNAPDPPEEKGSALHVVTDMVSLLNWLSNTSQSL